MEFNTIYQEMNLQELERKLQNLMSQSDMSILQMIKEVYEGNGEGILSTMLKNVKQTIFMEWKDIKSIFVTIIIIVLVSTMFSTFKDTFRNAQIAEISFYINYLLLIIFFMNIFASILEIGESTLKNIEEFMRIFFPTFF